MSLVNDDRQWLACDFYDFMWWTLWYTCIYVHIIL